MIMSEQTIPIPGRLKNVAIGGHVAGSEDIDAGGGKTQKQVNDEINDTLALHQSAIGGLNSQNYVSVSSYSSLPATGSADTIYRVSSWDGNANSGEGAADVTKYTEYAWNGTAYIVISVKTQIGEVFDISEYKAVGGTLATFENLSAALDNGNNVPVGVRKGGMSIKFVQSSDNKYVQYRLMSDTFNITVANWQGVDDEPTAESNNLVKSGGVAKNVAEITNNIKGVVIPPNILQPFVMVTGHTYLFYNTGNAGGNVYYRKAGATSSVLIGEVGVGEHLEFTATEDSIYVSRSNVDGFSVVVCENNSVYQSMKQTQANTKALDGIEKDLYFFVTVPSGTVVPCKMYSGHTYIIKNTGDVYGSIFYKVAIDQPGVRIAEISAGQTIEYTATVDSLYLVTSNIGGLQFTVCEKNSTVQQLKDVINNEKIDASNIAKIEKDLHGFLIPIGQLGAYSMKANHKYFFANTGTAGGNVFYRVSEEQSSVLIGEVGVGETLEFTATEDSEYVSCSNITGFSVIVYEDGSSYQKMLDDEMPFIIKVCSYNLGDFSGNNIVTPSDNGSLTYRKLIGSIGANLIGTQEDVLYYGGMESGENVRDVIYGMYKHYYRMGTGQFNYKGFASDYRITELSQIYYTDDVYDHPWFFTGMLNDVLVVSLHFDWRDITRRRKQIAQLIAYCTDYDKVILMGDTNPSNRINGEQVDPTIPEIHAEDWAYFANAGYSMANGGLFGDFGTIFAEGDYAGQLFPYDNIFVKGGYIREVEVISADYMNDHKPIVATVVF